MLIGYVSDERYMAIDGARLEFSRAGGSLVVTSTPRGGVYADLPPGEYRVALRKDGFGSKFSTLRVPKDCPYHFRLLSDAPLGYMWPKAVKVGETAEYRTHTVEEAQLSLWRYGYEKEFVRLINWVGEHGPRAAMQITPDGDYTQTGVRFNSVGYTAATNLSQTILAPEKSGLYYLHLKGKSGAFFNFPWIVAPGKPQAKIAVLAADMNWSAYNNFGGRSNYINAHELPETPIVNARQELVRYLPGHNGYGFTNDRYRPLSFERPEWFGVIPEHVKVTDNVAGRNESHTTPAEWRFLGWLEREGFAYDYYSETQLHHGRVPLDAYKVLIITVHPEYWSKEMYFQVKDWVFQRGGHLMYLGGNGINAMVEMLPGDRMRVHNHIEPPEKRWESRFHRQVESEANLLGVVYDERGIMTAAPYEVVDDAHWAFEGTGLRNGDRFGEKNQQERVWGGASGHETDKMSPSSPPQTKLLARGLNPNEGGAHMVAFETPSGGAVFSAGSITYVMSLLVDEPTAKVTANVLRRFLR